MKNEMIIGVQVDLNARWQSVEALVQYAEFLSQNGYNTMYLYIESGIRTESFAFAGEDRSFSPDQVRRIVEGAGRYGIEIVPCFQTLGHAQSFLNCAEFAHLSETREKPEGVARRDFCPSLPETCEFLFQYLREACALFPADVVHIGCDEVNMIECSLCKKRVADGETKGDIFVDHVSKIRDFMVNELGKRVIIWDDMFDRFPEALAKLPKDVEPMIWEYDCVVHSKLTKYGPRRRVDACRRYRELGIKRFHGGPIDDCLSNIWSFTDYMAPYAPAGMDLTSWHALQYGYYLQCGYAGRLWASMAPSEEERIFRDMVREIFGIADATFVSAVRSASNPYRQYDGYPNNLFDAGQGFIKGIRKASDTANGIDLDHFVMTYEVLETYRATIKGELARRIYDDIMIGLETRIAAIRFQRWTDRCVRARIENRPLPSVDEIRQMYRNIHDTRQRQKAEYAKDPASLDYAGMVPDIKGILTRIDAFVTAFEQTDAFLEVRLQTTDEWYRPILEIFVDDKRVFADNTIPRDAGDRHFFSFYVPVSLKNADKANVLVRTDTPAPIDVWDLRILRCGGDHLIPVAVTEARNLVANAGNILVPDTSAVSFGISVTGNINPDATVKIQNTLGVFMEKAHTYTQY